ncbi:MAG TPA: ATP-dependent RNA helicase HrpA, partial [Gammaproteobacteria bacterium]|nr:ATP-dependent RNA helicase HrpA [Gammaproteobacteria bacterium]
FLTLVNLWNYLEEQHEALSQSRLRRLCQKEFLSYRRWREWRDTHRQLLLAARDIGLNTHPASAPAKYDQLHQALLHGLLDHIAVKDEKHQYLGCRNRKMVIFPGSGLGSKTPQWLMAAEIVHTTRLYARTVAGIQPQWVEHIGAHLLKHSYSEPHWQKKAARVGGFEKLTLYGLVINPRRRINYAAVDPAAAREIFIRFALVYGEWNSGVSVIEDNRQQIEDIQQIEARLRQRDLLISDEDLFAFYDQRLPENIHSGAAFKKWFRQINDPERLRLTPEKLLAGDAPTASTIDAYPLEWRQNGLRLPLEYHFEPGAENDGVTLKIPLAVLRQIDPDRCEWLVPGMLEEKILTLIKGLPKRLRKHFVPAPDFARAAFQAITPYEGQLIPALSATLNRMTGIAVPAAEWPRDLPPHLQMRFEIQGPKKTILASGRNLEKLRAALAGEIKKQPRKKRIKAFEKDHIANWDFGELPRHIDSEEDGYTIRRYPALQATPQGVALKLFDTEQEARRAMPAGLLKLLRLKLKQPIRQLEHHLPDIQQLCLLFSSIGNCQTLKDDLIDAAIRQAFLGDHPEIWSEEAFLECLESGQQRLAPIANEIAAHLHPILQRTSAIRKQLKGNLPLNRIEAAADIKAQLDQLIYPGFLRNTPFERIGDLPRYLHAIEKRLEKLDREPDKDRMRRIELEPMMRHLEKLREAGEPDGEALRFRWLIEELRVSLFAQELGVKDKVSPKRLEKMARELMG